MTTTRHTISATMQVSPAYWRNASDVPVWADSVQGAVQWAPYDSSITVAKVLNAATGRYELRLDWNRLGVATTQQVTHQVTTVVGKSYRLVASMYALMPKMTAYTIGSPSTSGGNSPDRDLTATPFEVWGVFTATTTSSFLTIKSPAPWIPDVNDPPSSGTVYVTQVALYEVVSTTSVDLRPMQAVARLDSEWSPYVRVDLTCPLPAADALSRIDPRGVSSSGTLRTPSRAVVTLDAVGLGVLSGVQRTNHANNPRAVNAYAPNGGLGWIERWFGDTGTGTVTAVGSAADGPLPSVTSYLRKTWTAPTSATGAGDIGFQHTAGYSTTGTRQTGAGVTAGTTYTLSSYLWASVTMTNNALGWRIRVLWRNAAGTYLSAAPVFPAVLTLPAGVWTRISATVTAPAGAAFMEVITSNDSGTVVGGVAAGTQLKGTALLVEISGVVGAYFDGDTPDTFTRDYAWTGTPHLSASTESAMDAGLTTTRRLDVHLRVRDVDYVAGTMRLELTSDEMYLQDFARYDTSTSTWRPPATSSLRNLVTWALGLFGWVLQAGTDATIDSTKIVWNLGESLWDFLDSYIRGSGKRLWCDEARKWWLTDSTPTASGTATITALTACTDALSRSDEAYGDAAVMEYTWVDAGGVSHRDYAFTYTTGLTTPKTVVQRFTDQQPAPGAVGVGVARLRTRAMSRGRAIRVRAVSSYAVTPGQAAQIITPVTTVTGALVSAVTWNLPEDEMDVATRDVVS